jgi:hypothetical protein
LLNRFLNKEVSLKLNNKLNKELKYFQKTEKVFQEISSKINCLNHINKKIVGKKTFVIMENIFSSLIEKYSFIYFISIVQKFFHGRVSVK